MRLLSMSLMATVIVATVALGAVFNWAYSQWFDQRQEFEVELLKNSGLGLASVVNVSDNPNGLIALWNAASFTQAKIELLDAIEFPTDLQRQFMSGKAVVLTSEYGVSAYYLLAQKNAMLEVEMSSLLPDEHTQWAQLGMTLLFYFALAAFIVVWLAPLIRRLHTLNKMAKRVGNGDFKTRVATSAVSYIGNIEFTFNGMAQKIQQLLDDNKLLSRAVSHDLKTPLSRLRFGVEILQEENLNEKQQKYLAHLENDLTTMESLVSRLLEYAKLDEHSVAVKNEPVFLNELVNQVVASIPLSFAVKITTRIDDSYLVVTDDTWLGMVLNNIISNALRFASSEVCIHVECVGSRLAITIEDDGPGIAGNNIERLLKPFQKGESQPKGFQACENHGMGLAICEKLIYWLGLSWSIGRSQKLNGLSVKITGLKLAP